MSILKDRAEAMNVYIIAGPNGSGKTTFAKRFLPDYVHCPNFVNADLIAQGLSPFEPRHAAIKAGKLVLQQIHEYVERGLDFAFETTLSGKSYVRLLEDLRRRGYNLHLFFLWVPSPELAIARIRDRVAEGGHNVPSQDVKRRFARGIPNFFKLYQPLLASWMLFDNSGAKPVLISKCTNQHIDVFNDDLFIKIKRGAT
jgi:predicted ABC-type ATPase